MTNLSTEGGTTSAAQVRTAKEFQEFTKALMSTPQYQRFDLARQQLRQDSAALQAIQDFQQKQQYLQMMQMWDTISQADRDELQHLYERMMGIPAVQHYVHCQEELAKLFREVAVLIAEGIGTEFPPQRSSCCG
ncbi:MAG: YlbF family regulator [Anaerolineae bacterium]